MDAPEGMAENDAVPVNINIKATLTKGRYLRAISWAAHGPVKRTAGGQENPLGVKDFLNETDRRRGFRRALLRMAQKSLSAQDMERGKEREGG